MLLIKGLYGIPSSLKSFFKLGTKTLSIKTARSAIIVFQKFWLITLSYEIEIL